MLDAKKRREEILNILSKRNEPTSATWLSNRLKVSRQIIVGDVAILRAEGTNIKATHRGYVIVSEEKQKYPYMGKVVCRHTEDEILKELYCVVDHGGSVVDVIIDHSFYGQLSGILDISSRFEADLFVEKMRESKGLPLSILSGGIHLHTIGCENEAVFNLICSALKKEGLLFNDVLPPNR